jgi:uncharacterized protein (DUF2336 family)
MTRIGELVLRETLTPLLLLDLIAHGDLALVERGLAAVTGFDQRTVEALLIDRGWIGLRTLFRAAGFEPRHLWAIHTSLGALREAGGSVDPQERRRHAERCLSRFLTGVPHAPEADVEEVLSLFVDTDLTPPAPADLAPG